MKMRTTIAALALLATAPMLAQSSTSYRLDEHTFNAGGHPHQGTVLTSAGHRVSLDALGDGLAVLGLASASYRIDGGLGTLYPPPGEVTGLRFQNDTTLTWNGEPSVGVYHLYRGLFSDLTGLGYGACQQPGIATATTTDADTPPAADGYFYLVTAENQLGEEGGKGSDSAGTARPTPAACP